MTVKLSVDKPPSSVIVPLDPNDATKFGNFKVDPSIWKTLYTDFIAAFGSAWSKVENEPNDPDQEARLLCSWRFHLLSAPDRGQRLHRVRDLIYKSIHGEGEPPRPKDGELNALRE